MEREKIEEAGYEYPTEGVIDCPFWQAARTVDMLSLRERIFGGILCNYIIIDAKNSEK